MNRRQLLTATIAAPLAVAQNRQRSLRERLIGSWKLISWEATTPGTGEVNYPLGNAAGKQAAVAPVREERLIRGFVLDLRLSL